MKRGGTHGCKEEGREGQAGCEEEGREIGQEAGQEVVLAAAHPGVGQGQLSVVGVGKPILTLPANIDPADVTFSNGYSEQDEAMRTVMEVNEDPHDVLNVTIRKTLPVALESIQIHIKYEEK